METHTRENWKMDIPEEWWERKRRNLCPVCGKKKEDFDKYMRVFCSSKCRDEWNSRYVSWSVVREQVLERDNHTCVECGMDKEAFLKDQRRRLMLRYAKWAEEHQDEIKGWRAKELQDLSEEYERKLRRIMDDAGLAKSKMGYDFHKEEEKLRKGLDEWGNMEVDHIKPVAIGGDQWEKKNLRTLCHSCHLKKTAKDMKEIALYRKRVEGQKTMAEDFK